MTSQDHVGKRLYEFYGSELLVIGHHHAKFGGQEHCDWVM